MAVEFFLAGVLSVDAAHFRSDEQLLYRQDIDAAFLGTSKMGSVAGWCLALGENNLSSSRMCKEHGMERAGREVVRARHVVMSILKDGSEPLHCRGGCARRGVYLPVLWYDSGMQACASG
jgi:hypothetical protein